MNNIDDNKESGIVKLGEDIRSRCINFTEDLVTFQNEMISEINKLHNVIYDVTDYAEKYSNLLDEHNRMVREFVKARDKYDVVLKRILEYVASIYNITTLNSSNEISKTILNYFNDLDRSLEKNYDVSLNYCDSKDAALKLKDSKDCRYSFKDGRAKKVEMNCPDGGSDSDLEGLYFDIRMDRFGLSFAGFDGCEIMPTPIKAKVTFVDKDCYDNSMVIDQCDIDRDYESSSQSDNINVELSGLFAISSRDRAIQLDLSKEYDLYWSLKNDVPKGRICTFKILNPDSVQLKIEYVIKDDDSRVIFTLSNGINIIDINNEFNGLRFLEEESGPNMIIYKCNIETWLFKNNNLMIDVVKFDDNYSGEETFLYQKTGPLSWERIKVRYFPMNKKIKYSDENNNYYVECELFPNSSNSSNKIYTSKSLDNIKSDINTYSTNRKIYFDDLINKMLSGNFCTDVDEFKKFLNNKLLSKSNDLFTISNDSSGKIITLN